MLDRIYNALWQRLPPRLFRCLRPAWHLNPLVARTRIEKRRIVHAITAESGYMVQGGPFAGMRYNSDVGGALAPRLLGSYESELHEAFERFLRNDYDQIVNVGSESGYYAVGLARRQPNARVYASDSSPYARELCLKMAELNGVSERVTVVAALDVRGLESLLSSKTLIVMDCEGCERDLLHPDLAPLLTLCDLIVELHDVVDSTVGEVIAQRFADTHDVKFLDSTGRNPDQFPVLRPLSPDERRIAVEEWRPVPVRWAVMASKRVLRSL